MIFLACEKPSASFTPLRLAEPRKRAFFNSAIASAFFVDAVSRAMCGGFGVGSAKGPCGVGWGAPMAGIRSRCEDAPRSVTTKAWPRISHPFFQATCPNIQWSRFSGHSCGGLPQISGHTLVVTLEGASVGGSCGGLCGPMVSPGAAGDPYKKNLDENIVVTKASGARSQVTNVAMQK